MGKNSPFGEKKKKKKRISGQNLVVLMRKKLPIR
jgi:hypothetical protein